MPRYIVDTSVIRSQRFEYFEAAQEKLGDSLCSSPYVFWELARRAESNFNLAKACVRKFQLLVLLPEPLFRSRRRAGLRPEDVAYLEDDHKVIPTLVEAILSSNSYEELCSKEIIDPSGKRVPLRNFSDRVCTALAHKVQHYRDKFERALTDLMVPDDDAFLRIAWNAAQSAAAQADRPRRLESCALVFAGTWLDVLLKKKQDFTDNDVRDLLIAMHVDLSDHNILVTGDQRLEGSVNRILCAARKIDRFKHHSARVIGKR